MQLANIFPLSVGKSKIILDKKYKETLISSIFEDEKKGVRPEHGKKSAWLGDQMGNEYIHNDQLFQKLFKLITIEVKNFLDLSGYDVSKVNIYFQRSWATISREQQAIMMHDHKQSHLSFAYYLKFPNGAGHLEFNNDSKFNEIISGSFNNIFFHEKLVKKTTTSNAPRAQFNVEEDEIYIFPSKIHHRTQRGTNTEPRVSLSADIVLTLKQDVKHTEYGVADISNWKKFD